MGKSARTSNKARKQARAVAMLQELTLMIGNLFGGEPKCVEAAALFTATAARLGHHVEPRAVGVIVLHFPSSTSVIVGPTAVAEAEALGLSVDFSSAPDFAPWTSAGHVVATVPSLKTIFDPTFKQFSKGEIPSRCFGGQVPNMSPESGQWVFDLPADEMRVVYLIADDDTSWREVYDELVPVFAGTAASIADHLRNGGTSETGRFELID